MRIYLVGHLGMIGSAVSRYFENTEQKAQLIGTSYKEFNLLNQVVVGDFIANKKPYVIINADATVRGNLANNDYHFKFLTENMALRD